MWGLEKHLPGESWGKDGKRILNYSKKDLVDAQEAFDKADKDKKEGLKNQILEIEEFLKSQK